MTRVPLSRSCLRWLVGTAAALTLLALVLAGCASSTPSANDTSAPLPPSAAVGYWRAPASVQLSKLVCIRLTQGHYVLWAPPMTLGGLPLVVEGNHLVFHIHQNGKETERWVFWARPGGALAWADYLRQGSGTTVHFRMLPMILSFTKASGSAASLAAELRGREAEPTIQKQVNVLVNALYDWHRRYGDFPLRSALLPGGAFWRWKGAPHLTNAVTGGPMVLGSGAGNFDYRTYGTWLVSGHLYGGGESTGGSTYWP